MRLIVGGDSFIGSRLYQSWRQQGVHCQGSTRRLGLVCDERPLIDLENLIWPKNLSIYTFAVICAGINDIVECETRPTETREINVTNTTILAQALAKRGCRICCLSSSQVFDGTKSFRKRDDDVHPITEYGRQKVSMEKKILAIDRGTIIRLTKVENENGKLLKKWKAELDRGKPIQPFYDMYISPISVDNVVGKISDIADSESFSRLRHFGGEREISWAEYARILCIRWGCDERLIHPVSHLRDGKILPIHSSLASE